MGKHTVDRTGQSPGDAVRTLAPVENGSKHPMSFCFQHVSSIFLVSISLPHPQPRSMLTGGDYERGRDAHAALPPISGGLQGLSLRELSWHGKGSGVRKS